MTFLEVGTNGACATCSGRFFDCVCGHYRCDPRRLNTENRNGHTRNGRPLNCPHPESVSTQASLQTPEQILKRQLQNNHH